ncbi:MAG: hypothetical protein ACAH11_02145, partial [Sphingomonas sp.]
AGVTDVISPPGFDFKPEEFRAISTALVAVYVPNQFSIKTLNDAVLARIEDARYTKSRIGKFIQMLFWTRLFELAKPVGDEALAGVLIGNQQITLADVGNSFFRSLGYRMGNLRVVTPSEARRDIEAFLKAAAPALDAEQMTAAYIEGKTAANDAAAARGESL